MRNRLLWLLLTLMPGVCAHAGLITEGTRVIYRGQGQGQTLLIANTNPWPVLVQTWVDQGEGSPDTGTAPFVVLPAIFRLEPSTRQSLRIVHTGVPLPADRESLFWLNLYEVPPTDPVATEDDAARLTLTFNTQLKILYRPDAVAAPDDLAGQLQFRLERQDAGWCVWAHNPSPWHASISALDVSGMDGPLSVDEADLLLPPFSTRCYHLHEGPPAMAADVHFTLIGDSGFSQAFTSSLAPARTGDAL